MAMCVWLQLGALFDGSHGLSRHSGFAGACRELNACGSLAVLVHPERNDTRVMRGCCREEISPGQDAKNFLAHHVRLLVLESPYANRKGHF